MVSLKQEKFKLAEYYFRKAVEINPYNPILQTYVAMVVQKDPNRLLEALEIYRTAKVEPSYSLQSAQIYFELKDYQQAKTILENVQTPDSNVLFLLGKVYKALNMIPQACLTLTIAQDRLCHKNTNRIRDALEKMERREIDL
jgi:tetratricopeptide (TPR) repeat protein